MHIVGVHEVNRSWICASAEQAEYVERKPLKPQRLGVSAVKILFP